MSLGSAIHTESRQPARRGTATTTRDHQLAPPVLPPDHGEEVVTANPPRHQTRQRHRTRHDPGDLSEEERTSIRATVLALPPMSDEQVDALAEAVVFARARHNSRRHH